jgi:putative methyltransferase
MRDLEVQLVQVNFRYGDNAYLPYSVGLLESYVRSDERLKNVSFRETIFLRQPINETVNSLNGVNVLAISCYLWNWNWSLELAKAAKKEFPGLIIVLGGPQVPEEDQLFLEKHSYLDFLVFNEGELVFANLLFELSQKEPNFENVPGIRFRMSGEIRSTPAQPKIEDLNFVPSPYLSGTFDKILTKHELQFQVTQETHRGCPYSCTFCDWGSATMSKVRRFPKERIFDEYKWFGKNEIELLYNADANYGLFVEDLELTEELIETKKQFGFPKKFRAAYAKNSNDRVFEIANMLEDENMCKGVTLSFQSMDTNVLDLIKRKNMKINNFRELITTYREAKIPTYTELIIGLPGETYETFKSGINLLLDAGQHDSLSIYNAMLLQNSEMNKAEYRELHGIEYANIPLLLLHGSIEVDDVVEYYDVVTATASMPKEDWVRTTVFAWVVQALHCLNLTQTIAVTLNSLHGVKYTDFYEGLIVHFEKSQNHFGKLIQELMDIASEVSNGRGSLDLGDRSYGNIMWPVEEIVFLRLINSPETFPLINDYLLNNFPQLQHKEVQEMVRYQELTIKQPNGPASISEEFEADWHTYVSKLLLNQSVELNRSKTVIGYSKLESFQSLEDYAREVVWYGRKGSSLFNPTLFSLPV